MNNPITSDFTTMASNAIILSNFLFGEEIINNYMQDVYFKIFCEYFGSSLELGTEGRLLFNFRRISWIILPL